MIEKYLNCNHIWTLKNNDYYCIKCGLDMHFTNCDDNIKEREIYEYLQEQDLDQLLNMGFIFPFDSALILSIYLKTLDKYGNISDINMCDMIIRKLYDMYDRKENHINIYALDICKNINYKIASLDKYEEFKKCKHLTINNDSYCIKCGLNDILENDEFVDYEKLSFEDKISFDYLYGNDCKTIFCEGYPFRRARKLDVVCDPCLAKALYNKLVKTKGNFNEKYFNAALYNMHTKDNYESRKKSRIKRLSLNKDFNNWNCEL